MSRNLKKLKNHLNATWSHLADQLDDETISDDEMYKKWYAYLKKWGHAKTFSFEFNLSDMTGLPAAVDFLTDRLNDNEQYYAICDPTIFGEFDDILLFRRRVVDRILNKLSKMPVVKAEKLL